MRSLTEYKAEEADEVREEDAEEKARRRAVKRRWLREFRGQGPDGEGIARNE